CRSLLRVFCASYETMEVNGSSDHKQLFAQMRDALGIATRELARFRKSFILRSFKFLPFWLLVCASPLALLVPNLGNRFGIPTLPPAQPILITAAVTLFIMSVRVFAARLARPAAVSLSNSLARARRLHNLCQERAETHYKQELERIRGEFSATTQSSEQRLRQGVAAAGDERV